MAKLHVDFDKCDYNNCCWPCHIWRRGLLFDVDEEGYMDLPSDPTRREMHEINGTIQSCKRKAISIMGDFDD